jgi:hypothetical protein
MCVYIRIEYSIFFFQHQSSESELSLPGHNQDDDKRCLGPTQDWKREKLRCLQDLSLRFRAIVMKQYRSCLNCYKRRRSCFCCSSEQEAVVVAVVVGCLRHLSKSCGRAVNSLKMALAPALLRTLPNFVIALCQVLKNIIVA